MDISKIIYNIFIVLVIIIAVFVVGSMLPIPGNYKILVVLSGSMEPAIHTGSVVIVKPEPDYKIGDVITFGESSKTKTPTTHRIVETKVEGSTPIFITKGDANNAPDARQITKKEIIGKVLFSVPYAGYAISTAKKPLGFLLIIIIPSLIIILDEGKKVLEEVKKPKKEKRDVPKNDQEIPKND